MKPILKYPGAKNRIAKWIVSYIPEHDVYVEPFAGSCAILLNKPPATIETLNDLDGDIVNYFRCLRDHPDELIEKIRQTPYAREEYEKSFMQDADSDIERARRFAIRCWQGFGNSNRYRNGWKSGQRYQSPNCAHTWYQLPDTLQEASQRLRKVQIEHLPALEVIRRYGTKDVFLYVDPPYCPDLRKSYLYQYEMSLEDHQQLLKMLKQHPGYVMISGYDHPMYEEELKGWHKECRETTAEGGKRRKECIWMNYDMQMRLF